jgi:hypothetical protein
MPQITQNVAKISFGQWFLEGQLALIFAFASGSLSAGIMNLAATFALHLARITQLSRVRFLRSDTRYE